MEVEEMKKMNLVGVEWEEEKRWNGVMNDEEIRWWAVNEGMVEPFVTGSIKEEGVWLGERKVGRRVVSYGLSSYGYDARLGDEVKIYSAIGVSGMVDPKGFDEGLLIRAPLSGDGEGDRWVSIPPHSFALGHTEEWFRVPREVLVTCIGKSTYCRCGLFVNVSPLEPEWEGQVTLGMFNAAPSPVKVYVGEGICQFVFHKGGGCEVSYKDRGGKYQGQMGVAGPR